MKLKVLLFSIFSISLFSLGVLITTISNTAPTSLDVIGMFYVSLFFTLYGIIFFFLLCLAYLRLQAMPPVTQVISLIRLSGLVSLFVIGILAIQSLDLLNIATFLALLAAAVILELVMRRRVFK